MHRYVSAGFDLHPVVTAFGRARADVSNLLSVREGTLDDLDQTSEIDRTVRGTDRGTDIEFLLGGGNRLLIDDNGGYAVTAGGRVAMLSSLDDDIAGRLLLAAIAQCRSGEPIDVGWLTARQQWAIQTLTQHGVSLHVHQSVMMRGGWEPELPYLAHGIFG